MPKMKSRKPEKILRGGLDAGPMPVVDSAHLTADQQRIERLLDIIPTVCSGQWRDEVIEGRSGYPIPGMVLSRCKTLTTGEMVSNNHGEQGTRRWHPLLTDSLEDMLDRLPIGKAEKYVHPPAICLASSPYREKATSYDPRCFRVDDPDASITRFVRLQDWPAGQTYAGARMVRATYPNVFKIPAAGGGWLKHKGKDVLADGGGRRCVDDRMSPFVPDEAMVTIRMEVTE